MRPAVFLCALVSVLCVGCAAPRDGAVRASVRDFTIALNEGDGASVCARLSDDTIAEVESTTGRACPVGVLEEDLGDPGAVEHVEQWGQQAQVTASKDTLFLSHFSDGWKVVAAGCTSQPGRPYDCKVAG